MKFNLEQIQQAAAKSDSYISVGNTLNINRKQASELCKKYGVDTSHFKHRSAEFYIGAKYGKLTILKVKTKTIQKRSYCECLCDCGKIIELRTDAVKSLTTLSCGCFHRNKISLLGCNNPAYAGFPDISGSYFSQLKKSAVTRNIIFSLSKKYLQTLYEKQNKRCALTNIPISFGIKNSSCTASLDRIDSLKGYIEDNVQFVIKDINLMKRDLDEKYFIYLCNCVALVKPTTINESDINIWEL